MAEIKWTITALAAQYRMTLDEFAKKCDISPNHLKMVSAGNVKMWAEDLVKIKAYTGIPMDCIETDYIKKD